MDRDILLDVAFKLTLCLIAIITITGIVIILCKQ